MGQRGVFFAIDSADEARLLSAAGNDTRVMSLIEEIEERWESDTLCEVDKAWDAIHRALTIDPDDDEAYRSAVLGGRDPHSGNDYIVSYHPVGRVEGDCVIIVGAR